MTKFYFEEYYIYNDFGADEHLQVTLWRDNGKPKMKLVNSWSFSTGFFDWQWAVAHRRADRRIAKLIAAYGAKPL